MAAEQFYKIVEGTPAPDIGKMRHLITIQDQEEVSPPSFDASGRVADWVPVLTNIWAAIDAMRGTDVVRGGQTTTQLFLSVVIWNPDAPAPPSRVKPNMRVLSENGSVYLIQSIENVLEMNVILVLNCIGIGLNA